MCVIYACHAGMPNDSEMMDGAGSNTDGAGICWVDGFGTKTAQVKWAKGLESDPDVVKKYIADHKITFPFAIHFRTASIGGKCDELTHPFALAEINSRNFNEDLEKSLDNEGSARRVLMHNGHINEWKNWLLPILIANPGHVPSGPWSDSRALAIAASIKGEGILDFISTGSRVMILDSLPSARTSAKNPENYFRLFGSGWIHHPKEGYSQSAVTPAMGRCRFRRAQDYETDSREAVKRDVKELVGGGALTVIPPKNAPENCWTINELETLLADVRKEQAEARVLLGIGE